MWRQSELLRAAVQVQGKPLFFPVMRSSNSCRWLTEMAWTACTFLQMRFSCCFRYLRQTDQLTALVTHNDNTASLCYSYHCWNFSRSNQNKTERISLFVDFLFLNDFWWITPAIIPTQTKFDVNMDEFTRASSLSYGMLSKCLWLGSIFILFFHFQQFSSSKYCYESDLFAKR